MNLKNNNKKGSTRAVINWDSIRPPPSSPPCLCFIPLSPDKIACSPFCSPFISYGSSKENLSKYLNISSKTS